MKITIISHVYQDAENRKNIYALQKYAKVQVILQNTYKDWRLQTFGPQELDPEIYRFYKSMHIFGSQYIFLNCNLGIRQFNPDLILIDYNPWSIIFLQLFIIKLLQFPKTKIVCHVKKNTFIANHSPFGLLKRIVAKHLIKYPDYFFAASQMVSGFLQKDFGVPKEKIREVYHLGVDTETFTPEKDSTLHNILTIGYVGRFEEYKGVLDLVEAVKMILDEHQNFPEIRLCLLGKGRLETQLYEMQEKMPWLEIYPQVAMHEVPLFLRKLDIFVLPSRILQDHQEHDAHALMEAMSAGLACIGSNSGIIQELLVDGAGILVDPESPSQIRDAIIELILGEEDRKRYMRSARDKAINFFSNEKVAQIKYQFFKAFLN